MDLSPTTGLVTPDHLYAQVLAQANARAFEWGVHDCVTFAAAVVLARTGRDVLAMLRLAPTWRTAAEATAAIESVGGLHAALVRLFGEPVGVLQARAGDVTIANDSGGRPGRDLLAVVHHGQLLTTAAHGLAALPLTAAIGMRAWRVAP